MTRKCSQKWVPKLAPKTWPKVWIFFKCVASFKSKKVANPVPTKIFTPSKQKIYWFFEMVEDCWSKFAVPIQLKNCSATRKSNEHTEFLLKNASWALKSKAETFRFATVRLPPNEAGNPCVLRPMTKSLNIFQMRCLLQEQKGCQPSAHENIYTLDLAPPLGAVCVIDTKLETNSLTTCMFLSLFALWCWRLKVAYSKLIFRQRRAFRNKKEEPEGLWGSTRPELFVFIDRAQNVRPTKLR